MIKQTEAQFQKAIIDLAHLTGWMVSHFRGVRTQRKSGSVYYQTPVAADGKGFPDLVLVRERVIFAEIKVGYNKPSPEQTMWLELLAKAGQEVYVWTPKEWDEIKDVLQ